MFSQEALRPGWRNWQTRQTQNLVLAREWEFDPPSGHHDEKLPRRVVAESSKFGMLQLQVFSQKCHLEILLTGFFDWPIFRLSVNLANDLTRFR